MLNNFRLINRIFEDRVSTKSAALSVFIVYIGSAFFGMLRNRVLAGLYGDTSELGMFYMADKLPSLVFSILIFSVTSAAFFPVYFDNKKVMGNKPGKFTSVILTWSLLIYGLVFLGLFIFSQQAAALISWSSLDPEHLFLLSQLLRILLISQFPLIVSTYFAAFLQSEERFIVPSLIPLLNNVGMIVVTILFFDKLGIYATAYGALAGSFLGMLLLLPFVSKLKFEYEFSLTFEPGELAKVIKLAGPRLFSVTASRVYILVINGLITYVYKSPSYVVIYEFANQLQNYPVNAFGTAFSQVLSPNFARYLSEGKSEKLQAELHKYLLLLTYYMLPIVILFFVLRIPLVRLLYGGDKFSWLGTNLTAYTLAFFSISMWGQAVFQLVSKVFYAHYDSKTPTFSGLISLTLSFILSFLFSITLGFGVWGLALSFSIGTLVGTTHIYICYIKRFGHFPVYVYQEFMKILYATLICGFITYSLMKVFDRVIFDTTRTLPLLLLTFSVIFLGLVIYLLVSILLGLSQYKQFYLPAKKYLPFLFKFSKH
ncbi:oligosaccharide flippase family protein [bacterium]|nr:oligosaccharide flippase family protein [bacterium]